VEFNTSDLFWLSGQQQMKPGCHLRHSLLGYRPVEGSVLANSLACKSALLLGSCRLLINVRRSAMPGMIISFVKVEDVSQVFVLRLAED
jgi:hypothetical protein